MLLSLLCAQPRYGETKRHAFNIVLQHGYIALALLLLLATMWPLQVFAASRREGWNIAAPLI